MTVLPLPAPPARPSATVSAFLQRVVDVSPDDFMPVQLEIIDRPPSPARRAFFTTLVLLLGGAILWSCLAGIDEFATAQGRITPTGRSKVIQTFEIAKVQSILVANGDHVIAGSPLIVLDPTEADADLTAKRDALQTVEAQIARRRAAIAAIKFDRAEGAPDFPAEVSTAIRTQESAAMQADIDKYSAQREQLTAKRDESAATVQRFVGSIAARQRLLALLNERTDMKKKLVTTSSGTLSDLLDVQQKLEQTSSDLAYDQGQLGEAKATQVTGQRNVEQSKTQALAEQDQALAAALEKEEPAQQDLARAMVHRSRMTLVAPVTGTVQQVAVTTVGQVVTAGQQLATVIPSDAPLSVQALIADKDARSIAAGQEVVVKVDAFPYTRYGVLEGEVVNVSSEAIKNPQASADSTGDTSSGVQAGSAATDPSKPPGTVLPVDIQIARTSIFADGKDVPLLPGMSVTVDIRTSRRHVIGYLLGPIMETVSSAGHER